MNPRIAVIGSGFAALTAVRELRRRARAAEITVIAPEPVFTYYPSLIWVPAGLRDGEELRIDIRGFLARQQVRFHAGAVSGLAERGRVVQTDRGEVANDALIIASGGRFLKALPGSEHVQSVCEGVLAAQGIRERLAALTEGVIAVGFGTNPKEQGAMRGGPMFELLFGIDTLLRKQGRRERFRLVFFNAAARPGNRLGEEAAAGLLQEMRRRDIETHLGHKILGFEKDRVKTEGGELHADLILFMPGMTGPAWAQASGLTLSPGGFFKADAYCQVEGAQRVFVAGDAGSFPGPDWLPKQAHMADVQAKTAVRNLLAVLDGRPPTERMRAELVCIVDMLDRGILVYRSETRSLMLPPSRFFHWAKRFFEWLYTRPYRAG